MRNALTHLSIPAFALAAALAFSPLMAHAQSAVKATVNDQPITSYEVGQRTKLMKLFHQKGAGEKQALEDLIDETLAGSAAAARKIGPTDAMVEERFNGIAKQVKLAPAQFVKALGQAGVQAATLKKFIRAQMTWGMILQARARSTKVSESDIQNEIVKEGIATNAATIQEFMLQQIVFVVPKGSSPGYVGQRQRDAEAFRKRFTGCDGSLELAKSIKGVVVLNMGRRDTTQVPGPVADELKATPAGGTLKPQVTDRGVEVIAVCTVKQVQSTAGVRAEVQTKLTQEATKDLDKSFKAELRKGAKISYN